MNKVVTRTILIPATSAEVWHALTTPDEMKHWLSDTEVVVTSDWAEGNSMTFSGKWHSKSYQDKGIIIRLDRERIFEYKYRSNFSKVPDGLEYYAHIRFELHQDENGTLLRLTHSNIPSDAESGHANYYWMHALHRLKNQVETRRNTQ